MIKLIAVMWKMLHKSKLFRIKKCNFFIIFRPRKKKGKEKRRMSAVEEDDEDGGITIKVKLLKIKIFIYLKKS